MPPMFCYTFRLLRHASLLLLAWSCLAPVHALDTSVLKQVGYHPGGIAYYDNPYFANALHHGAEWLTYTTDFGTAVDTTSDQFNPDGYPKFLKGNEKLRGLLYGLHTDYEGRPPGWPVRHRPAQGHVVLTWKGDADIRLAGGTLISGGAAGSVVDGRRVYRFSGAAQLEWLEIHAINAAKPVTEIRVWLPDPADPQNRSLEGQVFHPLLLARLADADWGFIRFMNWQEMNGNPEKDWSDRRRPSHAFMTGVLNHRNPAPGTGHGGDRFTGVALENLVALCNASGRNLWLCVPHLATDEYVTKMAQVVRYGSDGSEPYTTETANPVHPPLRPDLKVFVEYSNEIWSSGGSFPQGDWAQVQADAEGISKARFNARGFCRVWSRFQSVFGGADRLARVASTFTALDFYSREFLDEIRVHGATLNPPVEADVLAVTTYFGNGIQDWVNEQGWVKGKIFDDPYWTSAAFTNHLAQTHDEWMRRMLSGSSAQGGGFDATSLGGGFSQTLRDLARTNGLPIIAYEGGPSLYTDYLDRGGIEDDSVTIFVEALNRHQRMREIYRAHLNLAKQKGLWTHSMFVDSGVWSKFGQWGHIEHLDQTPASSPKYQFILDWFTEAGALRHIDAPLAAVPRFDTLAELPVAEVGRPYAAEVVTAGGDGARLIVVTGVSLAPGLAVESVAGEPGKLRVSGSASAGVTSYLLARVTDADGDPAWRIFTIKTVGGPGTLVEFDFHGAAPIQHLPWNKTFVRAEGITTTGWTKGSGVFTGPGDDALVFGVDQPPAEADATLTQAIADREFLSVSFQADAGRALDLRGKEVRFSIRRIGFHSPRRYAVFTSVGGFAAGAEVFTTPTRHEESDEQTHMFTLPDTVAYGGLTNTLEFRIYGFSGQFGSEHKTSLTAFKLFGQATGGLSGIEAWRAAHFSADELARPEVSSDTADPDTDGIPNVLEYAFGLAPKTADPNASPSGRLESFLGDTFLTLTFTRAKVATDLSFTPELSRDLATWTSGAADIQNTRTVDFGETERVTVRLVQPISAHTTGFLRLRVGR